MKTERIIYMSLGTDNAAVMLYCSAQTDAQHKVWFSLASCSAVLQLEMENQEKNPHCLGSVLFGFSETLGLRLVIK